MMTQKELDIINNILDKLEIPSEFGGYEEGGDYYLNSVINQCEEMGLEWDTGASKFVIFPNDCNYVIKIPMNGAWYYSEGYDEETEEYIDGEDYFEEYSGAYGGCRWDYCNAEVVAYADAKEAGFEDFLAETKYIGKTSDGTPAYVQEKMQTIYAYKGSKGSRTPSPESSSYIEAEWETKFRRFCDKYWLGLAIDDNGEDKVEGFINFVKNHDCLGSDMHSGNYGMDSYGRPKLIDYSGFWN